MYALELEPEAGHRLWVMLAGSAVGALLFAAMAGAVSQIGERAAPTPRAPIRMRVVHATPTVPVLPTPEAPPLPTPSPAVKHPEPPPPPSRVARKKASPRRLLPPPKPMPSAAPPVVAAPKPPPLVVGLTLSSTSRTGRGPSVAVGNTLMGTPDTTAKDPSSAGMVHAAQRNPSVIVPAPVTAPSTPGHATIQKKRRSARLRSGDEPKYPQDARRAGVEGTVVLSITIDTNGRVEAARVLRGLGFGLDESALRAARNTTWTPATVGKRAVRSTRKFNVRFSLQS